VTLGAGDDASVGNSVELIRGRCLIVTGLVQEARIAAGPGMTVICSSSDPQQLRALLTTSSIHPRSGASSASASPAGWIRR
jgi:adenosylhomocysteine nucleosidase